VAQHNQVEWISVNSIFVIGDRASRLYKLKNVSSVRSEYEKSVERRLKGTNAKEIRLNGTKEFISHTIFQSMIV